MSAHQSSKADDSPERQMRRELRRLRGVWQPVRAEFNGKIENLAELERFRLRFRGEWLLERCRGRIVPSLIRLNPTTLPAEIDLENPEMGTIPGIYAIEGDTLILCLNAEGGVRPRQFYTYSGSGNNLLVLRRAA